MSDNIPFEIQSEIIKRLPVKSLIQFRSVSRPWKSLIDSSDFIAQYHKHTQLQHLLVTYDDPIDFGRKYVSIADDDETFPQHKVSPTFPLLVNMLKHSTIIGTSHGLFCLYGEYLKDTVVIWNISISKAVAVVLPDVVYGIYGTVVGFGVCRETNDPKIVKITYIDSWKDMESISCIPLQVEVFALSTGVWRSSYSSNLPRKSIHFDACERSVVIDGVLYWLATDRVIVDGGFNYYNLIISFDMTSEEFKEVYLPDSLAHLDDYNLSISKLRKYLVVLQCFRVVLQCFRDDAGYGVWMMFDDAPYSFTRLFTVNSPDASVTGFRKTGEPIIELVDDGHRLLLVYDPYSKDITNLEVNDLVHSFCVYTYIETLLLHDQPDRIIYDNGKTILQSEELITKGLETLLVCSKDDLQISR